MSFVCLLIKIQPTVITNVIPTIPMAANNFRGATGRGFVKAGSITFAFSFDWATDKMTSSLFWSRIRYIP